ncbi:MAG: flavodoxin family protein [Candidatus Bipolaricaulaceae bacterium]
MNIGMIIHSQTGNTYSVARKLEDRLKEADHTVFLERLEAIGQPSPRARDVRLRSVPDPEGYDALVLGAPVHAFSLSAAMQAYLKQIGSLEGKRVALLVTQRLPFRWLGGNRAVRQMRKACRAKGAQVCGSGVVNWSRAGREQRIAEVVEGLSRALSG